MDSSLVRQFLALGAPAAAHQLAGNFTIFGYMAGYGLAVAATTLVGQSIGAGKREEAREYGRLVMWIAIPIMTFIGTLVYFLSPLFIPSLGVYTLGILWGFGLWGVWFAIALDNGLRAILLLARFRGNRWIKEEKRT